MFSNMIQTTGNVFSTTLKKTVLIRNLITKPYESYFAHILKKKTNFVSTQDFSLIKVDLFM